MAGQRIRRLLVPLLVAVGLLALASAASATITPSASTTATAPLTAGGSGNVELTLNFAPSTGDSPHNLTLNLPPGLLTNVAIDNGGCLQTTDIQTTTCQIGSGIVVANLGDAVGVPTPVDFFLVPPPSPSDLAGLAVASGGSLIGTVAPIVVRPSGSPDGVGATIDLTLPDSLDGIPMSISQIQSTFNGMRFPTTCPSTPAQLTVSADSYADPTVKDAALPLPVTGCASLPYAPQYSMTAVRDRTDKVVKVTTQITQTAAQSPNSAIVLAFPSNVITSSLNALGDLCSTATTSGCTPVGSVTATSPLYPASLSGQAYLTGQATDISGLSLTLVFPPPFPLTLVGKVNIVTAAASFSGLPDIPLTDLNVTLNGGVHGLFESLCTQDSGTSTATLTDQNGDKTVTDPAPFTLAGCPATKTTGKNGAKAGKPTVTGATLAGLASGRPALSFTAAAGKHGPKLSALTVSMPKGLTVVSRTVKGKKTVAVRLTGAKLKSATLSGGKLVITARNPAGKLTVRLTALKESRSLKAKAKKLKGLKLHVVVRNAKGKRTAASAAIKLKRR